MGKSICHIVISSDIYQVKYIDMCHKTSVLDGLQEKTLLNATQPTCKIHPFSKIAVALEPVMLF